MMIFQHYLFFKSMIRQATAEDVELILALQYRCYSENYHEEGGAFLAKIQATEGFSWVIEEEGKLLAYLIAVPTKIGYLPCLDETFYQVPEDADMLYLHDMTIAPEARGRGFKHLLLEAVFQSAQHYPLKKALLISVQNSSSIWKKEGFIEVDPLDVYTLGLDKTLSSYGKEAKLMQKTLR